LGEQPDETPFPPGGHGGVTPDLGGVLLRCRTRDGGTGSGTP
jgi:hypothetical protein